MGRLISLRFRLTRKAASGGNNLRCANHHIRHLKAHPRPRPLSLTASVNPYHSPTYGHLTNDLILLQHLATKKITIKRHRPIHISGPNHIFHTFNLHPEDWHRFHSPSH